MFRLRRIKRATFRLRARPGADGKFTIVIQRRRWLIHWMDWYPVPNAVQSLYHRVIDLVEEAQYLKEVEIPKALAWEKDLNQQFITGELRKDKGPAFRDDLLPLELPLSDVSKRYEEVTKQVSLGGGNLPDRPEFAGHRTLMLGPVSARFNKGLIDRSYVAGKFKADSYLEYRPPNNQGKRGNQRGQNQNQNRGGNNQGGNDQGQYDRSFEGTPE